MSSFLVPVLQEVQSVHEVMSLQPLKDQPCLIVLRVEADVRECQVWQTCSHDKPYVPPYPPLLLQAGQSLDNLTIGIEWRPTPQNTTSSVSSKRIRPPVFAGRYVPYLLHNDDVPLPKLPEHFDGIFEHQDQVPLAIKVPVYAYRLACQSC
jgi:hypothetical protein